jgi:hypothetical protein
MSDNYYGYNYELPPVMGRTAACSCQRICYSCNSCNHVSIPFQLFNTLLAQYYANISIVRPVFGYNTMDVDEMINRVELPQNTTRNRCRKPFTIICLPHGNLTPKVPRK